MLLGNPNAPPFEVYNDYNANLVNLFRCMRDRPLAFIRELGFLNLNSRDDFKVMKKILQKEEFGSEFLNEELELSSVMLPKPDAKELAVLCKRSDNDHDLKRAVIMLKLLRYSYSSSAKSFSCQPCSIRSLFGLIQQLSVRMDSVVVENQDFEVLINHYDRPETLFYCDPPYYLSEYVYECGFEWADHIRLHNTLAGCEGKWLLSYNDCPEIRGLYDGYCIYDFSRIHSMVQRFDAGREFGELLIGNYDLKEREREQPKQLSLFGDA